MHRCRLDVRGVLEQALQNVDRFPDAAWDEMAEQGDVRIRDVVVSDATVAAIPYRVLGKQAVLRELILGPIRRSRAAAPDLWQIAPVIGPVL